MPKWLPQHSEDLGGRFGASTTNACDKNSSSTGSGKQSYMTYSPHASQGQCRSGLGGAVETYSVRQTQKTSEHCMSTNKKLPDAKKHTERSQNDRQKAANQCGSHDSKEFAASAAKVLLEPNPVVRNQMATGSGSNG